MDRQTFEELVHRLEAENQRTPQKYRRRVTLMAMMGYAYISAVIVMALLMVAAFILIGFHRPTLLIKVAIYMLLPLIALMKVIGATLFARLDPPQGLELRQEEHPELFATIEEVRRQLQGPRLDRVLLTDQLNAAVWEIPRFGIIGPRERFLELGLPLMQALDPAEFRSVLGHEFGHLAGEHMRQSGWIYHLRRTWARIGEHYEARGHTPFMFGRFFDRFIPRFMAYSFVLARGHEYEADQAAARVTSPEIAARALTRVNLAAHRLQHDFWPSVYQEIPNSPAPPRSLYLDMDHKLSKSPALPTDLVNAILEDICNQPANIDDTHPAFITRVQALEQTVAAPPPPQARNAAEHFLGERAYHTISQKLSQAWARENTESWVQLHQTRQHDEERLASLEAQMQEGELDFDDLWERAQLLLRLREFPLAEAAFEAILERWPSQQGARMTLGLNRIQDDDPGAIPLLEAAIDDDIWLLPDAGEALYDYYVRQGDAERAAHWEARLDAWSHQLKLAREERNALLKTDTLLPHDLPSEEVERLVAHVQMHPDVHAIWLASKTVEHLPDSPCYVLGIKLKWRPWKRSSQDITLEEVFDMDMGLEHEFMITDLGFSSPRWVRKMVKKVPDARIL
ncbi:hypothetical protein DL240_13415 [Lujinxingia litoralis]|uniref:Peptidase M48 domain-containing protein n=1 Tax=Lujinxingia litoralis TaxID=2211119 RepID=A0A328C6N0_9DELT|nr:M48 family metallopeptidase [Lujinxingia litoralis]RAL21127.1 hypothetical protein DL240_13415 [Lujinxingia litoralis]